MNIENTKAQMRKGTLELCILAILYHKDAYSTEILEAMKEKELVVVEGTIYPLLTRMKNAHLLAYRWEESEKGPPRKYYAISAEGKTVYTELLASWKTLSDAILEITQHSQK